MQQVQNPIFGGAIPMEFGLPQVNQIPAGYQSALAQYRPSPFVREPQFNPYQNNNNGNYYDSFNDGGGSTGSEGIGDGNASASDMGGEDV
jgi:hypothetical protein